MFEPVDYGGGFNNIAGPFRFARDVNENKILLVAEARHTNPNGVVHGGVILTMMDIVLGQAVEGLNYGSEFNHPVTMQIDCRFISSAVLEETLIGTAWADRVGRSVGFSRGEIRVGDRLVATGSAIYKPPVLRTTVD